MVRLERDPRALLIGLPVVLLAFVLRVWHLAAQSFWWDEAYSTMVASASLPAIVAELAREDYHPPLHYFLLHYWLRLAGQSEFSLRFLSVTAGVLTVVIAWPTAKRLLGRSASPIAALVFAVSPYLWYYAREARMFALVPLFGTVAIYCCARGVQDARRWPWVAYGAAIALGFYSLYYAIFLPFVCGLWVLLVPARRPRLASLAAPATSNGAGPGSRPSWQPVRDWALATAAAFVLFVPWLPIFLARSSVWASGSEPVNGPVKVLVWTWPELLFGLPDLALYQQVVPVVLLALAALLTITALAWAGVVWFRRPGALLAALAFLVPLLTIAAISAVKPVYHPRYAIPVASGLYLVLAGLIASAVRPSRYVAIGALVLLLVCSAYGLYQLDFNPAYARDDYRGAIAFVERGQRPGDVILDNAIPPFWYYYHGAAPATYFPTGAYSETNVVAELNEVTRGKQRLWYVQHNAIPNDPDGFVDTQLRLHATRLDERWFGPIRVQLWQLSPGERFAATTFTPVSANVANELTLMGYAVAGDIVGGRRVDVELEWRVQRQPAADDGFWVALTDAAGRTWGRADTRPRDAGYKLSSGWPAGETVVTRFDLPIAVGTPPGRYRLVAGVYRLSDLSGLSVLDAGQHPIGQQLTLGSLGVAQPTVGQTDPTLPDQLALRVRPALTLAAAEVGTTSLAPGDQLPVTLLWRANGVLPALAGSIRLVTPSGLVIATDDRPLGDTYPTDRWKAGVLVREQRLLDVPASAPAGPASLSLRLSDGTTVPLATVTIKRISRDFTPVASAHPLRAILGGVVALVGYDLSSEQVTPGGSLTVTLDWQDLRTTTTSYHVFVHLLDSQNHIWAQWDGVPRNWTYPTSAWVPGEYVADRYPLQVSPATPAGSLVIEVGLYDAATGRRLPITSTPGVTPSDHLILHKVQVVASPSRG